MCGLWGYFGRPTKQTTKVLYLLGLLNEERGGDSAGLVVSNGKRLFFHKNVGRASKFLKEAKTIELLNKVKQSKFINVIGHTRQATHGIVNADNAHPFRVGKFVLAHNGVINNFAKLQADYKTTYQVDSQIIGHLLNLNEPVKVFEEQLGGWFTVPYIDLEKKNELNIVKHNAPLAFAFLQDGSGIYYSSLGSHLKEALKKAGIRSSIGDTGSSKLYTFKWEAGKLKRDKFKIYNKVVSTPVYYDPDDYYSTGDYNEGFGYGCGYKYSYNPEKSNLRQIAPPKLEAQKATLTKIKDIVEERKKKLKAYDVNEDGTLKRIHYT